MPPSAQPEDGQRRQRGALGQAVDDQIFLHRMNASAAHAHRVDHRDAAGGDIIAVAHPAGRLPADRLAKVGAGLLDQPEQALRLPGSSAWAAGRNGRGRGSRHHARPRPPRPRRRSAPAPRAWSSSVAGRRLTRSTARSGTTLLGPPPSIFAGLTDSPARLPPSAAAPGRRRRPAHCGRPPGCARRGPSGRVTVKLKLPLPGRAPARVPSGSADGS